MGDHANDALDQMMDDLDGDYQFEESPHYGWETRKSTHWARVGDQCIAKEKHVGTILYCSGKFVIRTNRRSGKQFLGCSHYPNCRQTAEILPSRRPTIEGRQVEEYDRELNPIPDVPDCEL